MDDGKNTESGVRGAGWRLADLGPVLEALKGIRYGSVELIVQDGRLVQIDRKEKIRFFRG
ncbi:MAG TPA: YezD family protein [Fibrobacteria bacterium]|nr:YezD family protein [Fibrobacteria bacterium]